MREQEEIAHSYNIEAHSQRKLNSVVIDVLCYRGPDADPRWVDDEPGEPLIIFVKRTSSKRLMGIFWAEFYAPLCTIYADTSKVIRDPCIGLQGVTYYVQEFRIILLCGLTELQAQIAWTQDVSALSLVILSCMLIPRHGIYMGVGC